MWPKQKPLINGLVKIEMFNELFHVNNSVYAYAIEKDFAGL
jgi:hypothetical protein